MKNSVINALKSGAAPLVLGTALVAGPAFAQDAKPADDAASTIVVTGSLIKNPNLVSANPVNVTTAAEIELKQANVAETVLREIPGVVPNIGSAVNNGNGGSSYVDLRGLGSNRNVVLLDGNRLVPVDLSGRLDLNNIPLALISRIDTQTGAAVTTYGADAIAGVVNFITKKNFSGIDLSVGEAINQKGDGNAGRVDMTVGGNFADNRGNAVLSIGYQKSDAVYQGDRDYANIAVDSFSGTPGGSGTTVPSRISGTRGLTAGVPNTVAQYTQTGTTLVNGVVTPVLALTPGGAANGGTRQVDPTTGNAIDTYSLYNFNPYNVFQVPFKRFNIFAQANYEISDSVEAYTRALFTKNTVDTIIAPSGSFGGTITVNLNNPYLPAALRNQLCAFNTASVVKGVNATGTAVSGQTAYTPYLDAGKCALAATATGPSDPNYKTATIALSRRAVEVGPRISDYSTTVFDYRLGFRGHLNDHINWDINGSYGESQKTQQILNYTLQSRLRQASLANNTTSCIDPSNGCVPINPFGAVGTLLGTSNPSGALSFISQASSNVVKTSLGQARGVISGDVGTTSPWASKPISFAAGAEYRKYHAQQSSDLLAKTAGELGGAGGAAPDINGSYDVWEAFGELVAPLVEDKPGFKSLTLDGGARYSNYKVYGGDKTNTTTYKGGLSWEPMHDLKFRANYAHAVRAPNIGELFTPVTTGLTSLTVDPCVGAAPTANANLRAVCIAQGAPAGTIGSILNPTSNQANETGGGNFNVKPEKADTYTIGLVMQPRAIPHFSLSVDYYHIVVNGVIGTPLTSSVIAKCFGNITAASAADPNCTSIRRNPITGGLDGDPATTPGVPLQLGNLGRLYTSGVDVLANWSHDFNRVKYAMSFVFNYTGHSDYNSDPAGGAITINCAGLYGNDCGSIQPKIQWSMRNSLTFGKVQLSLLWRHIGAEKYETVNGNVLNTGSDAYITSGGANYPAFNGTLGAGLGALSGGTYDFAHIKAANYFDLSTRFDVSNNFTLTLGIDNLLNKQPPIVGYNLGTTSYNSGNTYPSTYDALGRRFAASAHIKF